MTGITCFKNRANKFASEIKKKFLSLESQHTIGYGVRYMTDVCPPAYIILCNQLILGVLLQTVLAGIVIAKVLRPKKRKQVSNLSIVL